LQEYIIKTWGEEYPYLAQNEYFCLRAVEKTGVKIPNIILSKNKNFLLVERFNYDKDTKEYLGFEEVLVLMGKNKEDKYSGSYESVAKVIYLVTTNKLKSMEDLYKTIIMGYLLKNGNGHLKNFGVIYDNNFLDISFAPAYDIVNTCVYIYKDRPALTMFGQKVWFGKKELIKFGIEYCFLPKKSVNIYYDECIYALTQSIAELERYIISNEEFKTIGLRMIDTWNLSLKENKHKELPIEIIRNWAND
jgi:serine/threonine-protein kinase HipA